MIADMRCRLVFELAVPRTHSVAEGGDGRQRKKNKEDQEGAEGGGTRDLRVGKGNCGKQKGGVRRSIKRSMNRWIRYYI